MGDIMGAYKDIKRTFSKEYKERSPEYSERMREWRSQPSVVRAERPTNVARARELGYKAKEGVIIARARVKGGAKKRPKADGGRKPSKSGRFFTRAKSMRSIAEERASRKFPNFEVLNSYFVGHAGSDSFYEIILLNKNGPSVDKDRLYKGIVSSRGRAYRGLTSSGRKHRGAA